MFSNYIGFEKVDQFLKKYYERWTHPDKAVKKLYQAIGYQIEILILKELLHRLGQK